MKVNRFSYVYGGAGLGILIGILIGMSTSNVVGIVLGALTSSILILLGLKDTASSAENALRVGSFGLFCSIAILCALYLRVNDSFEKDITTEVAEWTTDSTFTKEEAKSYVLYKRFGFVPSGAVKDTTVNIDARSTLLYSSKITLDDCEKSRGYDGFESQELLSAYRRLGGVWERLAISMSESVEPKDQKKFLLLSRDCLCNE